MSDVTTIPAAVLAEAYDAYREHSDARLDGFEAVLAVIARHWPAATPDRYAAGFAAGVEKAAERAASSEESGHAVEPTDHGYGYALACRDLATAIRALAPPDDGLIVGRLRWVEDGDAVHKAATELLDWLDQATWDDQVSEEDAVNLSEALRAALEAAVRREVEGGGDE